MTIERKHIYSINQIAMLESKIAVTERLRREGRWTEASEFREQERQRLRQEGMGKEEAKEEAWRLMAERFPHSSTMAPERTASSDEMDDYPAVPSGLVPKEIFAAKPSKELTAAISWVADHICIADAAPEDAPGSMAWSLLKFARDNPSHFWKDIWTKLLPSKAQIEQQERFRDDGRLLTLLDETIAAFEQEEADRTTKRAAGANMQAKEAAETIFATCVERIQGEITGVFGVEKAAAIIQENWAKAPSHSL
jgi:hypothetical protein